MDNARALFERALTAATPGGAPRLWDRFLAFEYEHGSLPAALAVQACPLGSDTLLTTLEKSAGGGCHQSRVYRVIWHRSKPSCSTLTACVKRPASCVTQERRAEALAEAAGDSTAPAGPPPGDDIHVSLLKYRCASSKNTHSHRQGS